MSAPSFSLAGLGPIINRWKRWVGGATLLAGLVAVAVVLSLPNIYKSTTVFLPTIPQTSDPDRLLDTRTAGNKLELGTRPEDIDRVLTIAGSQPIAEQMIKKYHLHKHYDAGKPGDDLADNYALFKFSENLSVVHTDRDALELTFLDRDKNLAAAIANDMVAAIDSVGQQLTLENRRQLANLFRRRSEVVRGTYEEARQQLVTARRRYGVFNADQQGRYLAKGIIETETALRLAENGGGGNATALRRALQGLTKASGGNVVNLENFTRGVDSVTLLAVRVNDLQNRLTEARFSYETAELGLQGRVNSLYVVQKAYPATKKTGPARTLIVLGSMLATFAFAVLVVALLEWNRRNRLSAGEVRA